MLNEGEDDSAAPAAVGAPGELPAPPPGTTYIQISPEEREAIDRVSNKHKHKFHNPVT